MKYYTRRLSDHSALQIITIGTPSANTIPALTRVTYGHTVLPNRRFSLSGSPIAAWLVKPKVEENKVNSSLKAGNAKEATVQMRLEEMPLLTSEIVDAQFNPIEVAKSYADLLAIPLHLAQETLKRAYDAHHSMYDINSSRFYTVETDNNTVSVLVSTIVPIPDAVQKYIAKRSLSDGRVGVGGNYFAWPIDGAKLARIEGFLDGAGFENCQLPSWIS